MLLIGFEFVDIPQHILGLCHRYLNVASRPCWHNFLSFIIKKPCIITNMLNIVIAVFPNEGLFQWTI